MTMKAAKKLADGMRGGKKLIFTEQAFDDWRWCQDYGQVFSAPQGAATPKNFQNPDFSLKWRDFWVFL